MRAPLPPPEQDPAAPGPRQPTKLVLVDVPPPRWWKRIFKLFAFLAITGATAALFVAGFLYWKYSDGLPDIPQVDQYRPPILTEVVTQDAVLAGEFYKGGRKVVAYQ